jgi:hypothetical protein
MTLLHTAGAISALVEMGLLGEATTKLGKEFAPGIPQGKPTARLPNITSRP